MPCCLFYCPLAFQRDPKPFKRVIGFRVSSPKKEYSFFGGLKKSGLRRNRIPLKPSFLRRGLDLVFSTQPLLSRSCITVALSFGTKS